MIDFIKSFFDIKKGSLFLVFTSYLAFNFKTIFFEGSFTITEVVFLILFIFFIEIVFKLLFSNNQKLTLLIIGNTFFIFFGYFIVLFFQKKILFINELQLRGRSIALITFVLFNLVMLINLKHNYFKIINTFFIIFIHLGIINTLILKNQDNLNTNNINNKYIQFKVSNKDKPLILIVTDEYHSPADLYTKFKELSIYDFANKLKSSGWFVNNNFKTLETTTNHSLASLLNFNLSDNTEFKNITTNKLGIEYFKKNLLYDSLFNKNINIINLGIFDIGKIEPNYRMFEIHETFIERIFEFTLIENAFYRTKNFDNEGFGLNFYTTIEHNKHIFEKIKNLNKINYKTFVYVHILMPHTPFLFEPEFKYKKTTTKNYLEFWKFTNHKLDKILTELNKTNKFKIILSGDHGYRYDKRLNPNLTFLALYGFEDININDIQTVQDLGSFINSNF